MSFPPLHPASQNPVASAVANSSSAGSARPRQSAWGLPASTAGTRRGLTPLSTNVGPPSLEPSARRPGSSNSTTSASPFTSTFSSVLNSNTRLNTSRTTSSPSSSNSPFTPLQAGSQQLHTSQLLSSPRSRTTTPFSSSNLASSAAASTTATQAGGGGGGSSGGGGPSRTATFSPSLPQQNLTSPTNATFDRNTFSSSALSSTSSSQSSVSKIVVTQVFLLLNSITEKEGKAKWDSQAEAIRKLVDSHGMEVFAKYFRRLLVGNSPQIFPGINRNVENPGNHQLLVEEVEKASRDPEQAKKIAEIIDTSEGDIYRDFDLPTFFNHFTLNPVAKTILASAFTQVTRPDLQTKAASILANNFQALLQCFAVSEGSEQELNPSVLAAAALGVLRGLSESSRDGFEKKRVFDTLRARYMNQGSATPTVIRSAMSLATLMEDGPGLAEELQKQGPTSTSSLDAAKDLLLRYGKGNINELQISRALLFLILTLDCDQHRPDIFVTAVRGFTSESVDWQVVVRNFDREGIAVSPSQFLSLYTSLLPIAHDVSGFDIQLLWGGRWHHTSTQLSFALGLASLSPEQLDARSIPRLRKTYDPKECSDGPDDVVKDVEEATRDPVISIDAVSAISEIMFDHEHPPEPEDTLHARELIGIKTGFFLCSAAGVPKPWSANHSTLMARLFVSCLLKHAPHYQFALHSLWKQDKPWVASRLVETHLEDPIKLPLLLEHAVEHGWVDELCTMINGFGVDLAALVHRKGLLDIDQWVEDKLSRSPDEFPVALSKFLVIKAQDEMRTVKGQQPAPRTVSLAMKTVHAMLAILEEYAKDKREELIILERNCMQAFPRLINYGEGFDDVIEANGEESNGFSQATDARMQELYKRMYSAELEVRDIIEALREYKTSSEPAKQDLFACMIHGLFDEYVCFNEYPLSPLATTAVLFGGIISFGLIANLTLNVALEMVLEAVRDFNPETSMYKFGLQALLHFLNRLSEWPEFCQQLVQIPGLQGTEAHLRAQDVLREERDGQNNVTDTNGVSGMSDGMGISNGIMNNFLSSNAVAPFRSIHVDPPPNPEFFEDPEEDVQDKVLFVLNNVSEQNINAKFTDLVEALEAKHHHWFAAYLVEQRAKLQPNYQQLYLDLLGMLGEKSLWAEVLRETFVSVQNLFNAESTIKSTTEQNHLINLGQWLGSLTIARDKPIKHRNIAFKELLLEGWETQRLAMVIKFTCAVLREGIKSVVFKPPNPWMMEIISLLVELYDLPELKINQKFAIEVLLRDHGMPTKGPKLPRSKELQKRQQQLYEDERAAAMMPELDGLDDMTIGGLNRGVRNARFSPAAIAQSLPDLEELLVFPPSSGSPPNQARLRQIVQNAVQRAIMEIIGPVVERSVTIATIATRDLIHKDYAQEPDEDRVREASQQMAKALSGSLALVTCKEPLRMSMTNYIRLAASEIPDQAFPEGSILMCVNDNLDTACSLVERQAEERSMPEINAHIDSEIEKRRHFKAEYPNESYRDPITSHWSSYIPEPYKQVPGGLNQEQLDIYLQFARQTRGVTNHVQTLSTDSGKQIPDVLQDGSFPSMPNLATPAEQPAVPLQPPQMQQQQRGILPSVMSNPRAQPQMNGFVDAETLHQHIQELFTKIGQLTTSASEAHFSDLGRDNPILNLINSVDQIISATSERDAVAMHIADAACASMYEESENPLEVDVLAHMVHRLCQASEATALRVILHFRNQEEEKYLNPTVTAVLLELGLLEFPHVDVVLAKAMQQRRKAAIDCLSGLLNSLLFTKHPIALRADFVSSLGAMGEWLSQDSDLEAAKSVIADLRKEGVPEVIEGSSEEPADIKQSHQMQYIFSEWLALCAHPDRSESMSVAFITQLHHRQILNTPDDMVLFLRLCIEASVEAMERFDMNPSTDPNEGFFSTDSLSRLLVLMVKTQGQSDGAVKGSKSAYMNSILSLVVLILNNHHVMRGEQFNQRMFYRLFSTMLFDWSEYARGRDAREDKDMIRVFADTFLLLDPHYFPGFVYGWLSLVSHRVFMPTILRQSDEGCEPFAKIMESMLSYVSDLLKPGAVAAVAKELYRGVLRILLILHHDFPEFLAENHYRLCNTIPAHCTQLRNLVLSAYPSSILELPDPFTAGLKVDRLDEIRKAPHIAGDILSPLNARKIKDTIDEMLRSSNISDEQVANVADTVNKCFEDGSNSHLDTSLPHAMILYIGHTAISSSSIKSGPSFDPKSPQANLMSKLAKELHPEPRYYLIGAIVNQLRYPNSHTHFFSYALLHLFGNDLADQQESDVRQQITRVLLERLVVHRPHPWGVIITLLELLKNPIYMFWDLPFITANPEVEKLFGALFQHINQSPRALV